MPTLATPAASPSDLGHDLAELWLRRAASGLLRAAAARRQWCQRRDEARLCALAEELSETLLRDIGAPDWLRDAAAARREAERQRAAGLRATHATVFG